MRVLGGIAALAGLLCFSVLSVFAIQAIVWGAAAVFE